MDCLPLVTSGLNRLSHRRRDPVWLAQAWAHCRVLIISEGTTLVTDDSGQHGGVRIHLVDPVDVPPDCDRYFLGVDGGEVPYFAAVTTPPEVEGTRLVALRDIGCSLSAADAQIFATGLALASWHSRHAYCPSDGSPTVMAEAGWTRITADERETLWPRTDPAVIALVHDGVAGPEGRCLLARNAVRHSIGNIPLYSCLAGFVEPGESAESAVAREIGEEVGLAICDIRYVTSQPWPFPGCLMLGFTAIADPSDGLYPDETEITEAHWFTRAEIIAAIGDRPSRFCIPATLSISHYLIVTWAREQ